MSKSARIVRAANVAISEKKHRINLPEGWGEDERKKREDEEARANEETKQRQRELADIEAVRNQTLAEARSEAARITSNARTESARIIAGAEREANSLKSAIFEESRELGYEEGISSGKAEGERLAAEAAELIEDARETRRVMLEGLEPELVELVSAIAEKLLRDRFVFRPETILCLIRAGLSDAAVSEEITVRVSPDDYEAAVNGRQELMKLVEGGTRLEIIKDFSLNKADCIIETEYGYIDSSFGQQMDAIKENLYYLSNNIAAIRSKD